MMKTKGIPIPKQHPRTMFLSFLERPCFEADFEFAVDVLVGDNVTVV